MSRNPDEDNLDETTDAPPSARKTNSAQIISGPSGIPESEKPTRGGVSDEELASTIRARSTTVSTLGSEVADQIEQGLIKRDDATEIRTQLEDLSELLAETAET